MWKNKYNSRNAAAILIFKVMVELRDTGHFVAPKYLVKVTEVLTLTPSGL